MLSRVKTAPFRASDTRFRINLAWSANALDVRCNGSLAVLDVRSTAILALNLVPLPSGLIFMGESCLFSSQSSSFLNSGSS